MWNHLFYWTACLLLGVTWSQAFLVNRPSQPSWYGNHRKRNCNSFQPLFRNFQPFIRPPDYDDRPVWGSGGAGTFQRITRKPITNPRTPPTPTRRNSGINRQKCQDYCQTAEFLPPPTTTPKLKPGEVGIFVVGGLDSQLNEFPHMKPTESPIPTTTEEEVFTYGVQGGMDSEINEFPHMVSIGFTNAKSGITSWNSCGGTLISHWFVMTAAHCLDSDLGMPSIVRLGALNVNQHLQGQEIEDIPVADVQVHPSFQGTRGDNSVYNDIALLRLERRVNFREGLQPACLYDEPEIGVTSAVATGWGNLGFADAPSDLLQKVQLDIIPHQRCAELLGRDAVIPNGVLESQLCAGVLAGGFDTCSGDSGGPLQTNNTRTFVPGHTCGMEVIGVTSFGKFCAQKNSPGVYTRVSDYVPWIESIVWPLSGEYD